MKLLCLASTLGLLSVIAAAAGPLQGEPLASFPPFNSPWPSSDPASQEITDDGLELRTQGVAFAWLDHRLTGTTMLAEVEVDDADAVFLAVRVAANPPLSGYVVDVSRNGNVSLAILTDGKDMVLTTGTADVDFTNQSLMLCHRIQGQRLSAWIWSKNSLQPAEPTLETLLTGPPAFEEGRSAIGVRGGGATFSRVEVVAETFRPSVAGVLALNKEFRFRLIWESEPNEVYRIDTSPDRTNWQTHYLFKATDTTSEAVIPASFSAEPAAAMFFRVVTISANAEVPADLELIRPATPRLAVAWSSSEQRVYRFEWSQDLEQWESYGGLAVTGADGKVFSSTVLPLPQALQSNNASPLYVRVVDFEDKDTFGLIPVVPAE